MKAQTTTAHIVDFNNCIVETRQVPKSTISRTKDIAIVDGVERIVWFDQASGLHFVKLGN